MRYSDKEAFNSCPQKFAWQLEGLKKQNDDKTTHHKIWGAAIHSALEAHYGGKSLDETLTSFKKVYPVNLDQADLAKTVENGVELLKRYVDYYKAQDETWEILATEHEGLIEIGDEEHGLHIDIIARHKQTQEIYFWDHKTSGKEPSATYWKAYELSGQVTRYTDYIKQKYGSCAGCYINNIALKFLKRKNVYGEGPGLVVKFERQLFNRTPEQVKFWKESDVAWMQMMEFAREMPVLPKALNTLCAWCEFYELCLASGDEQIKELLYKQNQQINVNIEGV